MRAAAFDPLPAVVAHADWSIDPAKRWLTHAVRRRDGVYWVAPPVEVGDCATLLTRLARRAQCPGPVLLGFDLPAGLPLAYARRAGIGDFGAWLVGLGEGAWAGFYDVAEAPAEIALTRPFYPKRPGGTSRAQLVEGLGLAGPDQLYRVCDVAANGRPAASPLFWTLGAKQVGKAALSAWRELLVPTRRSGEARLWPFDGTLAALLGEGGTVLAETYPAEIYRHLGLFAAGGSKRRQADRAAQAPALEACAKRLRVRLSLALRHTVETGFGPRPEGEDPFDATVGLLGMLNLLLGGRDLHEPEAPEIRRIEGWILGQAAPTSGESPASSPDSPS